MKKNTLRQFKRPDFSNEWDTLQPHYAISEAMINSGLTEKELSERSGISKREIAKLGNGRADPSLKTLQKLAAGLGFKLRVEFVSDEKVGERVGQKEN